VHASGIYIGGNYTSSGSELWAYRVEPRNVDNRRGNGLSRVSSFTVRRSEVYVAGTQSAFTNPRTSYGFAGALTQDLPAQLQVLHDEQMVARDELAVLKHSSEAASVDGGLDLAVTADINGNGGAELAALGLRVDSVENGIAISDALTGAPLRQLYDQRREAGAYGLLGMVSVPDADGNGYPELVLLKSGVRAGRNDLQVKDGLTGRLIGNVFTGAAAARAAPAHARIWPHPNLHRALGPSAPDDWPAPAH
jgi:hypothetical protein